MWPCGVARMCVRACAASCGGAFLFVRVSSAVRALKSWAVLGIAAPARVLRRRQRDKSGAATTAQALVVAQEMSTLHSFAAVDGGN